ncbi:hypothetical protein [Noviherbaspirillum soli]|uniref:hypothetical protein n=1 Tax=Noviherbaspirillum soli TaxID=1064518 RepID=UPI001E38E9EB|nr:hypothetical protein [Noviherbaspirillum soli]
MSRRHWLLAACLMGSLWLVLSRPDTADSARNAPSRTAAVPAPVGKPSQGRRPVPAELHLSGLHERETRIGGAGAGIAGANLFDSQSWTPSPVVPASRREQPAAPPLPYRYVGKKFDGMEWEVYLARGDEPVVVREQSVLDASYRVTRIKPPLLSLIFLPLNQVQTMTIGDAD